MSDLRSRLIEAGDHVLAGWIRSDREDETIAVEILDAFLDVLEANADEWDDVAHAWADKQGVRDVLGAGPRPYVAVLRDGGDESEEH